MDRMIHTAIGVRDVYGEELRNKRHVMAEIHAVLEKADYEDIETPSFEYFDVFASRTGTTPSRELYKFFDREGDTLVLRPDFTPSIARAVCMHFAGAPRPLRLSYQGNTFVNSAELMGRLKETTQMGVERIGENSAAADAEVIALTIRSLLAAGLEEFQVSVGEVEFFRSLAEQSALDEEQEEQIRHLISRKNFFGVEEMLDHIALPEEERRAFITLPQLFGGAEVLAEAEKYVFTKRQKEAVLRLREIWQILGECGLGKYVTFDFGMLSRFHYYTGIIFSAFTYGTGEPVAKGGRYDGLLACFGADEPAVGFAISVNPLLDALRRSKRTTEE